MTAVVKPDVAQFRQWYPEFADVTKYPDAVLQARLEQAQCYVSNVNFGPLQGKCRLQAIYLMTAHLQALTDRLASGQTQTGFTTSTSIDKVSVSVALPPYKTQLAYWLNTTPYGAQLLALLSSYTAVGTYFGGEYEKVFR